MFLFYFSTGTILIIMSRAEEQETTEYYRWLLQIEKAEFEKELLDIAS